MISYISHHTSMYFLHLPSGGDDVPTVVEVVQKHDLDEKSVSIQPLFWCSEI